jgi:cytochrome P450
MQHKARAEITELLKTSELTFKTIRHLPYTWAIFRETLRLFPTVPINARNVEETVHMGGYTIPKGCRILINTFSICRDESNFKDAESFVPERWSESELKNYDITRNFGGGLR